MPLKNEQLDAVIQQLQSQATPSADGFDGAVCVWEQLAARLNPLLGSNGVAVIYARSLDSVRHEYPWLPPAPPEDMAQASTPLTFAALTHSLSSAGQQEAVAANNMLLDHFVNLLADLIGARLTTQFLRPRATASNTPSPQQETKE